MNSKELNKVVKKVTKLTDAMDELFRVGDALINALEEWNQSIKDQIEALDEPTAKKKLR